MMMVEKGKERGKAKRRKKERKSRIENDSCYKSVPFKFLGKIFICLVTYLFTPFLDMINSRLFIIVLTHHIFDQSATELV